VAGDLAAAAHDVVGALAEPEEPFAAPAVKADRHRVGAGRPGGVHRHDAVAGRRDAHRDGPPLRVVGPQRGDVGAAVHVAAGRARRVRGHAPGRERERAASSTTP
jgi:hypothetical protein